MRVNSSYTGPTTFTITIASGIATLVNHNMLPYLRVAFTDGSGNRVLGYVGDVIDMDTFSIYSIPAVPTQPTPVLPRSDLKAHVPAPSLDPCQARVSGAGQRH